MDVATNKVNLNIAQDKKNICRAIFMLISAIKNVSFKKQDYISLSSIKKVAITILNILSFKLLIFLTSILVFHTQKSSFFAKFRLNYINLIT